MMKMTEICGENGEFGSGYSREREYSERVCTARD